MAHGGLCSHLIGPHTRGPYAMGLPAMTTTEHALALDLTARPLPLRATVAQRVAYYDAALMCGQWAGLPITDAQRVRATRLRAIIRGNRQSAAGLPAEVLDILAAYGNAHTVRNLLAGGKVEVDAHVIARIIEAGRYAAARA